MPWKILIGGVDKTSSIHKASKVGITLERNHRGTAKFTCVPGYVPTMRQEVAIYDTDGTTVIFGGIIFDRKTRGSGGIYFTEVECVDWSVYTSWRTASYVFSGNVTLKSFLQAMVTTFLSDYGISLDAGQVDGPTVDATNYVWVNKRLDEALDDATKYSGGYSWSISPAKVLKMILNATAPAAPFSITDATAGVQKLEWKETSSEYATKVIMLCGGTGTKELTQTWTVSAGDISNGYLETDVPSTPTGGITVTVNGSPKTVGGAGKEIIWNWATHRLTAGTFTAVLSDVVVVTYTGQYPFSVNATSGATPPIEVVINSSDIVVKSIAQATVDGLLPRYNQTAKHVDIETTVAGLRPSQLLSVNSTKRATGAISVFIETVDIELVTDSFWKYRVTGSSGVPKTSGLDYFRSLSGVSTSPPSGFTTGVNPGTVVTVFSGLFLGGRRNESVAVNPAVYTPISDYVLFSAPATFTGIVRVEIWSRNAAVDATVRLRNVTDSTTAGTSSLVTATTPTKVSFSVSIIGGKDYRLEILPGTVDEGVYAIGTLESS